VAKDLRIAACSLLRRGEAALQKRRASSRLAPYSRLPVAPLFIPLLERRAYIGSLCQLEHRCLASGACVAHRRGGSPGINASSMEGRGSERKLFWRWSLGVSSSGMRMATLRRVCLGEGGWRASHVKDQATRDGVAACLVRGALSCTTRRINGNGARALRVRATNCQHYRVSGT